MEPDDAAVAGVDAVDDGGGHDRGRRTRRPTGRPRVWGRRMIPLLTVAVRDDSGTGAWRCRCRWAGSPGPFDDGQVGYVSRW